MNPAGAFLPDQTRISQVHLRTTNLQRAAAFYVDLLGLATAKRELASAASGPEVTLSPGPNQPGLLLLGEDRNASPRLPQSVGLYHVAFRYPTRTALAQACRRILQAGYPVVGAADHGVSEAVYLTDPEGNGVELYADRPRAQWRWQNGQVAMQTAPLSFDALLATDTAEPTPRAPVPPELGHIHLRVASLAAAERFYSQFLGLAVTQRSYPGALFFAAGGYHHHVAVNVWAGKAAPPANSVGLVSYRLEVPVAEILYCLSHRAPLLGYETRTATRQPGVPILQIRDPNGNWLEIQVSTNPTPCKFQSTLYTPSFHV